MAFTLKDLDTYLITDPTGNTHLGLLVATSATYTNIRWYYDGELYGHASGYGYSMTGSTMGDWLEQIAQAELCALVPGSTYHFYAEKETPRHKAKWALASVKHAHNHDSNSPKDPDVCYGLRHHRYMDTAGHATVVSRLDGATGSNNMIEIAGKCGYIIRWVPCTPNDYHPYVPVDFVPKPS